MIHKSVQYLLIGSIFGLMLLKGFSALTQTRNHLSILDQVVPGTSFQYSEMNQYQTFFVLKEGPFEISGSSGLIDLEIQQALSSKKYDLAFDLVAETRHRSHRWKKYWEGVIHLEMQAYRLAVDAWHEADLVNQMIATLVLNAELSRQRGDWDTYVANYEAAAHLSGSLKYYEKLFSYYLGLNLSPADFTSRITRLAVDSPYPGLSHYLQGRLSMLDQDWGSALDHLMDSVSAFERDPYLLFFLGSAHNNLGNQEKALQFYNESYLGFGSSDSFFVWPAIGIAEIFESKQGICSLESRGWWQTAKETGVSRIEIDAALERLQECPASPQITDDRS